MNIDIDATAGKETSVSPDIKTIISPIQNMAGMVKDLIKSTMLFPEKNCPLLASTRKPKRIMTKKR
jgi:hypothetical protein